MFKSTRVLANYILFALIIQLTLKSSIVNAEQQHMHSAHKTAVGIHGMAIITDGTQLFASHMPLANSIHAHQVVFSITLSREMTKELSQILVENTLVSLMPERFDLMKLMSGELTSFRGSIYAGHFERGGEAILTNVKVEVEKLYLVSDLATGNNDNGLYYLLKTSSEQGLLVHRIVSAPSFDQIVQVSILASPVQSHSTNSGSTPLVQGTIGNHISLSHPQMIDSNGYKIKLGMPLYLETRDFQ